MHNLEQRIAEWRKTLVAARTVGDETVDELESHLRETVNQLVRSGMTESEAFQRAVAQLGDASTLTAEFRKLDQGAWLPVKVITGIGIIAALALAVLLIGRFQSGQASVLLASHVFVATLGYTTTLLIGALGICFVGQRCYSELSPLRMRSLPRVTLILGGLAAGLTAVAILLGMSWAKAEWGRYWAWDAKEVGALAVIVWQLCFLLAHRLIRGTARGLLVMSVLGNIVVGWGWFGANIIGGLHHYGTASHWMLPVAAVVFNVAFFLVGLAPAGWLRLRKAS